MSAETLNCPMCGASAKTEATCCEHCGARLATVACPSCFGMMFLGQKFCPHCGGRAERTEVDAVTRQLCPRCRMNMQAVVVGGTNLRECPKCEGIWTDTASLEQICAEREKQTAVLGRAAPVVAPGTAALEKNIRYLPCPVCKKLMNRVNFANCSQVVVDVCKSHGTWFDKHELRGIVEFIRAGGLETARAKEISNLQQQQRETRAARFAAQIGSDLPRPSKYDGVGLGLSAAAAMLKALIK